MLNNPATLYLAKRNDERAEPSRARVLAIGEKVPGLTHRDVAESLQNLAASQAQKGD